MLIQYFWSRASALNNVVPSSYAAKEQCKSGKYSMDSLHKKWRMKGMVRYRCHALVRTPKGISYW